MNINSSDISCVDKRMKLSFEKDFTSETKQDIIKGHAKNLIRLLKNELKYIELEYRDQVLTELKNSLTNSVMM